MVYSSKCLKSFVYLGTFALNALGYFYLIRHNLFMQVMPYKIRIQIRIKYKFSQCKNIDRMRIEINVKYGIVLTYIMQYNRLKYDTEL